MVFCRHQGVGSMVACVNPPAGLKSTAIPGMFFRKPCAGKQTLFIVQQKREVINMKSFVLVILCLLTTALFGQTKLNPTGTYNYRGKKKVLDGTVFGPYEGEIQVQQITPNEIVMTFFICKGAPSFNSGSFVDTLQLVNNTAIYTEKELDSTCKITFRFDKKGVMVKEETADYNAGCGFGHAVVANGRFKKISSKSPVLVEPLSGEAIIK